MKWGYSLAMINTRNVTDRRPLRFESLDEAVRDAVALSEAERRGTLRATGNWTLGQAVGHLAFWARAPFEGYPGLPRPPWLLRVVARPLKRYFLNRGMPSGGRIPSAPEGTYGVDRLETDVALAQLRTAFARLAEESPTVPNLVLGEMTHEEWIKLNLRHSELHLSFFHAE
jgi:Protein of unknown function (DUF1569)